MSIKLALIGFPVGHSLSPRIFELIGRRLKEKVQYDAIAVRRGELERVLRLLRQSCAGCSVTIPHKRAVIPLLSRLTPEARAVGAVNAVRFSKKGAVGHNTDAAGFMDALEELGFSPAGRTAVIFGAGGAARAVGFALGRGRAKEVVITARSPAKGSKLASELRKLFPQTKYRAGGPKPAEFWINATPLGMKGFPSKPPAACFEASELAFDLVYNRRTPFLSQARRAGCRASDGLSMLVFQALRAWEFWLGPLGASSRRSLKAAVIKGLRK